MLKSQESSQNKPSIFEKAKQVYNRADQAVIKATTFDSKKAIGSLKRAAVLALGISATGIVSPNMDRANAANSVPKSEVPTVEQLVTVEANKSNSGVSKGGVAKGLNSVMQDGKFTDKEVATFVEARNTANGFRDKNKNTTDTNAILKKVNSGKNILEATSQVIFSSSEAKTQAAKDVVAGTKTDAEIYGKLVMDAQQSIIKKQAEQKSTITPSTKPEVKKNKTKTNGESKLPALNRVDPDPISFLQQITEQNNGVFARISSADDTIQSLELMAPVNAQMKEPFISQAKEGGIKWDAKPVDISKQKEQVEKAVKNNPNLSSREIFDIIYNESAKDIALTPDQLKELKSSVATKIKALREFYTNPNRSNQGILLPLYSNILDDFNKVVGKAQVERVDSVNRADYDKDMKNAALVALGGGLVVGAGVGSMVFLLRGNKRLKIANDRIAFQDKMLVTNSTQINSLGNTIIQKDEIIARKDSDVNNFDNQIAQQIEDIEVRDSVIENLNADKISVDIIVDQYNELKSQNIELAKGLSDITLIEKALRDQDGEKDRKIVSLEEQVVKLTEALNDMRQEIAELNSKVNAQPAKQPGLLERARSKVGQVFGRNKTSVNQSEGPDVFTPIVEALQPEIAKVDESENEPEITIEPLPRPKHTESVQPVPITEIEPIGKPEPIAQIEPLPKPEISAGEIQAKVENILSTLMKEFLDDVDYLLENSLGYTIESTKQRIKMKTESNNIILTEDIENYLLKNLVEYLIDSGKYEYSRDNTMLLPTKKPEIVQPQAEPIVVSAPQAVPQTYSSINSIPTKTNGHRNFPINENGVITAYNTGIGFIPENQPQKPTQSVNSAPAAPKSIEAEAKNNSEQGNIVQKIVDKLKLESNPLESLFKEVGLGNVPESLQNEVLVELYKQN
jgi:hypothetical protein